MDDDIDKVVKSIFGIAPDDGEQDRFSQMMAGGAAVVSPSPAPQAMWQRVRDQVAGFQKIDPQFSPEAVASRAQVLLAREFQAENAMDASGLAGIATPDFIECLQEKIAQWRAAGMRRVVENPTFDPGVLFKVTVDGDSQRAVVRMTGSAVRYVADAALGGLADGSRDPESFTEFVAMRRPVGAVTPAVSAPAAKMTVCPGCGAPISAGASLCSYCGTALGSNAVGDWLLDHLSQSAYT